MFHLYGEALAHEIKQETSQNGGAGLSSIGCREGVVPRWCYIITNMHLIMSPSRSWRSLISGFSMQSPHSDALQWNGKLTCPTPHIMRRCTLTCFRCFLGPLSNMDSFWELLLGKVCVFCKACGSACTMYRGFNFGGFKGVRHIALPPQT